MTKLRDLNPRFCPATSIGPGTWQLTFTCPKCGPGYEASIYMHAGPAHDGVWKCDPPSPPADGSWMDKLTVTPSIGEPPHGRKRCDWHGSITKGEVLP